MADSPVSSVSGLVETYRDMAERNPRDRYLLHSLLMAYLFQKSYDEGIGEFGKIVKKDDKNGHAHFCLAVILEKGGYFDDCIREYMSTIQLDPDQDLAYLFLSTRYLLKGEWDNAETIAELGLTKFPETERLNFNLGYACAQKRLFDKAIMAFKREIEISPQCQEAYFNLDLIRKSQAGPSKN
jgi:tetratricopeptide (TPR) repeat protein